MPLEQWNHRLATIGNLLRELSLEHADTARRLGEISLARSVLERERAEICALIYEATRPDKHKEKTK